VFDLRLSPEQLEIRDTVRDFVEREIKPQALASARLEAFERPLLTDLLEAASRLGLRTLALSEEAGGAGADALTRAIVTEELAAGDPDIAAVLAHTAALGPLLEGGPFLAQFLEDDRFHLAVADCNAVQGVLEGVAAGVANATVAKLFVVRTGAGSLLVPRETKGVTVREQPGDWYHGSCGEVTFSSCRVPAASSIGTVGPIASILPAISLGIGRAAYEAALAYAKLRVQGGKPIIGHQAIAAKLDGIAASLEIARTAVWRAAWASDHPEAVADRSLPDLPLAAVAEAFAPGAMLRAAKDAAECFGAMGVMRDMPLHKYVRDARICLHSGAGVAWTSS
jgi:acyl-CoA dehydrogenase